MYPTTMSQEQRRYPKRFTTQVPVEFLDKNKMKGTLMNLSREGILVVAPKLKPINSFVRLMVFIPNLPSGVEINGKVVRHTTLNGAEGMGISLLDMSGAARDHWIHWLSTFTSNTYSLSLMKAVMKERSISIEPFKGTESTFTIKFKSKARMLEFFPRDWENDDFFIRTSIKKEGGDRIILKLVHPETNDELKLNVIVQKFGIHPTKVHKEGLFFSIFGYNEKLKAKITQFLDQNP